MESFEAHERTARDGAPFSNSTESEVWYFNVCGGAGNPDRECVHNAETEADPGDGCPLITLAVLGKHPAEWVGARGRYRCTERTLPADVRRAEREAERAAVEAQHVGPLFDLGEVSP